MIKKMGKAPYSCPMVNFTEATLKTICLTETGSTKKLMEL
jgi:hypothetical protein